MVTPTLMLSGAILFLIAALFASVGWVVSRRAVSPEQQLPATAFAVWWFGYAAYTLETATRNILTSIGIEDVALHISVTYLGLFLLSIGLAGLMYYLIYVYTGSNRILVPLAAFYASFYFLALYAYSSRNPVAVEAGTWSTQVVFEFPENPLLNIVIITALLVPLGVGALLYSLLYFRVESALQKKRILIVGGAFLFWFVVHAFGRLSPLGDMLFWPLLNRMIALISALVILYAFLQLKDPAGPKRTDAPPTTHTP